jgi:hypothetical protein
MIIVWVVSATLGLISFPSLIICDTVKLLGAGLFAADDEHLSLLIFLLLGLSQMNTFTHEAECGNFFSHNILGYRGHK